MSLRRKLLYGKPKAPLLPVVEHHQIRDFSIQIGTVTLHGWLAWPKSETSGAILYFNGRRESPTTIFRFLGVMRHQAVAVFNYRGLGQSSGEPSEKMLVSDGLHVLDWLSAETQLPLSSIVIVGRSLGSGIAVQVCAMRETAGLILISPFDSLINVIRQRLGFFPDFLLQDKFNSVQYIQRINCKILSITGSCDTTIPTELTDVLFQRWDGELTKHVVPQGQHRGLLRYPCVENAVALFLNRLIDEQLAAQNSRKISP
ncbi:MAG: alpha/beta hydrolase [Rhodocyclaceae bacterium]|nr:alpha/beta hydrolase [Rhodocyclaceae bacterium]